MVRHKFSGVSLMSTATSWRYISRPQTSRKAPRRTVESLSITLKNQERRLTLVLWRGKIAKKPSKLDDYEDFDKLSSSGCSGKPLLKKPRKVLFEFNLDLPKSLNSVDLSTSSVEESDDENNDADNKDLDGSVAHARCKQKVLAKKEANGFSRLNRNTENMPHNKTGYEPKTIHKPLKENKKKAATQARVKMQSKKQGKKLLTPSLVRLVKA